MVVPGQDGTKAGPVVGRAGPKTGPTAVPQRDPKKKHRKKTKKKTKKERGNAVSRLERSEGTDEDDGNRRDVVKAYENEYRRLFKDRMYVDSTERFTAKQKRRIRSLMELLAQDAGERIEPETYLEWYFDHIRPPAQRRRKTGSIGLSLSASVADGFRAASDDEWTDRRVRRERERIWRELIAKGEELVQRARELGLPAKVIKRLRDDLKSHAAVRGQCSHLEEVLRRGEKKIRAYERRQQEKDVEGR